MSRIVHFQSSLWATQKTKELNSNRLKTGSTEKDREGVVALHCDLCILSGWSGWSDWHLVSGMAVVPTRAWAAHADVAAGGSWACFLVSTSSSAARSSKTFLLRIHLVAT